MPRPSALAVCTTAMGDTILSTPAMAALGETFDLDVLVHQHRLPLLRHEPYFRELYAYRNNPFNRLWLAWLMRRHKYQVLVVMHANDDLHKLLPLLHYERAGNLQGWNMPRLRLEHLNLPDTMHVVDKRLLLAKWAGADPSPKPMRVHILPQESQASEAWLLEQGLDKDSPRVALCPGAANLFKRWPADRFGYLVRQLRRDGAKFFVIGTGQEMDLVETIDREAGAPVPRLMDVDMRQLASAISRADLLVTNDTGPLHLGQAVGTLTLGLFGPTDPLTIGPRDPRHKVLKVPRTCDPCTTKRCMEAKCMRQLEVDTVLNAARDMLAQWRPGLRGEL